jgi:hypothetical protein
MKEDPIVAEVRKTRETHAGKYGNDLAKIYDDLKSAEIRENWPVARVRLGKPAHPCVAEESAPYAVRNARIKRKR